MRKINLSEYNKNSMSKTQMPLDYPGYNREIEILFNKNFPKTNKRKIARKFNIDAINEFISNDRPIEEKYKIIREFEPLFDKYRTLNFENNSVIDAHLKLSKINDVLNRVVSDEVASTFYQNQTSLNSAYEISCAIEKDFKNFDETKLLDIVESNMGITRIKKVFEDCGRLNPKLFQEMESKEYLLSTKEELINTMNTYEKKFSEKLGSKDKLSLENNLNLHQVETLYYLEKSMGKVLDFIEINNIFDKLEDEKSTLINEKLKIKDEYHKLERNILKSCNRSKVLNLKNEINLIDSSIQMLNKKLKIIEPIIPYTKQLEKNMSNQIEIDLNKEKSVIVPKKNKEHTLTM